MTPAERAAGVVGDFHAARAWGYDPVQHAEWESRITAAIVQAVAAERERIAKAAEELATQGGVPMLLNADGSRTTVDWRGTLLEFAARIREGK